MVKPIDASALMAMRKTIIEQNAALTKAAQAQPVATGPVQKSDFGAAMKQALHDVNAVQAEAGDATRAYTMGETNDIAAVMLAKQKASLGFEATLQVRNKLLSAYKDIMSMPV